MMITFAEYVVHKRNVLYFSKTDTIESLTLLIVQKTDELKRTNPKFVNKRARLKAEIADLKKRLQETIDKKRSASSRLTFRQLIALEDSYEKLEALKKKVSKYTGNKSGKYYKLALREINRLTLIKSDLIKKRKKELTKKWKNKRDDFETNGTELVEYNFTKLNEEIQKMYMLFTDSVEFRKQARKVKKVLALLLPYLKTRKDQTGKHLFKKYYSVWIDINELLEEAKL